MRVNSRRENPEFAEFYQEFGKRVTGLTYLLVGEAGDDLASEAFTRALARWETVAGLKRPDLWVRRVAVNLCISHLRRSGRERTFLLTKRANHGIPESSGEDRMTIMLALGQLPAKQKAALLLRYYEDLPLREIAQILRCATSTAATHVQRGLKKLEVMLSSEYLGDKAIRSRQSKSLS